MLVTKKKHNAVVKELEDAKKRIVELTNQKQQKDNEIEEAKKREKLIVDENTRLCAKMRQR